MQVQQWRQDAPAHMTFDEVSMERSKSFVKALQELKNLRPQLYSAAEYCEKSYLHNEQKQMVLDNLKDYVVRALVNAVDHLGTVAYKLTDLFEQQSTDVSNVELKMSCLDQQILTCQYYVDKEGIRQQQLLAPTPRHHKHYILPNSVSKKVRVIPQLQPREQNHVTSRRQVTPASKTLSWHLASESNSTPNESPRIISEQDSMLPLSYESTKTCKATPEDFHLLDAVKSSVQLPLSAHLQPKSRAVNPPIAPQTLGSKDLLDVPKSLPAMNSFGTPARREVCRPAAQSKGVLSVFFAKNKHGRQKKTYA